MVIALRQIQDGGGSRAYADASPGFMLARVDASTEFKMAVVVIFACIDALVNSQDGGHARALGGASIYNSRWRAPSLKFNVATA